MYIDHLKKCHPDVDIDGVLNKRAGSRRKSGIIGRDIPLPLSPSAVEPDRWSQAEHPGSMTSHLPVARAPSLSLSPIAPDSWLEHAEQAVASCNCDNASGLELPGTTVDHFADWSSKERVVQLEEELLSVIEDC